MHPGREIRRVSNRGVLSLPGAGRDRSDYHFPCVRPDSALYRASTLRNQVRRKPTQFVLHPERDRLQRELLEVKKEYKEVRKALYALMKDDVVFDEEEAGE